MIHSKTYADRYDDNIRNATTQYQIDTYFEPTDPAGIRRKEYVLELLQPEKGDLILDLGCGVGSYAFHSMRCEARAVAVDYSMESLRVAREVFGQYDVLIQGGVVRSDAMVLPFANDSYSKIVCADFVEHINEEEKATLISEMKRVVRPGGRIVVLTPNGLREQIGDFYWGVRNKLFGDSIPTTDLHFGLTTRSAFERLLRKEGFRFKLHYRDTTRPWLSRVPIFRRFLALYLLWSIQAPNPAD